MKFSFVIPALNEEKYLPHVLEDLKKQTDRDFEVIVVDGKSDDKTQEVAQSFAKYYPLTVIVADKRNVSYQRNLGASKAKGEYIVFLDADTRVPTTFLRGSQQLINRYGYQLILPSMEWDDTSQRAKILLSFVKSLIRASQVYGRPLSTGGNLIVSKKVFDELKGFNENVLLSEDHDFVRRAHEHNVKAKIAKNVKVTISMRRGELEGDASFIYKNVVAFLAYTMVPSEKALKVKLFDYEMGGHPYEKSGKGEAPSGKKKKLDIERLRQLLQLSAFVTIIRYWKIW
ncbi:MAG TPA: glycosyltransferase [Candidatus Saccharimonadales bacterium]|nr:glycosyltransferase [Candidatus Saccharimonadales bacterium]